MLTEESRHNSLLNLIARSNTSIAVVEEGAHISHQDVSLCFVFPKLSRGAAAVVPVMAVVVVFFVTDAFLPSGWVLHLVVVIAVASTLVLQILVVSATSHFLLHSLNVRWVLLRPGSFPVVPN